MDILNVLPREIVINIKNILFKKDDLTSTEKVKMYMVSKSRMNSCFNARCARIIRTYNVVKSTLSINIEDIKFIKKQINFIVNNELDVPENSDESSEEYKDYCYNLCFNFAFHKLFLVYLVIELGEKVEKDEYYDFIVEDKKYKKHANEIYSKLKYLNAPCEVPDVNNLRDFIEFIEKLSLKQKTWVGL
jgi:hypothetical protein